MTKFIKKIFGIKSKIKLSKDIQSKTIEEETNEVFNRYKKSFKDLALYDRGEKISAAD